MNEHYLKLRETTVKLNNERRIAEAISNNRRAETVKLLKLDEDYKEPDVVKFLPWLRTRYWLRDRRLGYGIHYVRAGDRFEAKLPTFMIGGLLIYPGSYVADLLINKGEFPPWLREHYKEVTFLERQGSFLEVALGTDTPIRPEAVE